MRKFYFLLFLASSSYLSYSQEAVPKIAKDYFRSDPFNSDFSEFITHLLNDPTLTDKVLEKRTDTSLFFFQGTYKTFNPFFFKPKRVEVVLTEVVIDQDSLPRDTIYAYELFAYDDATKEGTEEVKKEFDKIFHHYKGKFTSNQLSTKSDNDKTEGVTYNFFDRWHALAPFAVSWFGPVGHNEICLILTLRMDTYMNKAVLPMPFELQ